MTQITMKSKNAVDRSSLSSINQWKLQGALTAQNISALNQTAAGQTPGYSAPTRPQTAQAAPARPQAAQAAPTRPQTAQAAPARPQAAAGRPQTAQAARRPAANARAGMSAQPVPPAAAASGARAAAAKPLPSLKKPIQKGQKVPLETHAPLTAVKACFGWNTKHPDCDVDVSAFLLGADGRVPGDSWFVFYGQTKSPDNSCIFQPVQGADREMITIDFQKLSPSVKKIVFVLTINEAFEKRLHFGMMKDAYVRILLPDETELTSFKMTDYYTNVISMMIGEIYQYKDSWKFSAVGNGVSKDLAGLCALYGVQVSD